MQNRIPSDFRANDHNATIPCNRVYTDLGIVPAAIPEFCSRGLNLGSVKSDTLLSHREVNP